MRRKRREEVEQALEFSRLPARWREKSLENLEGQEELKIRINHYLDHFPEHRKRGRGLYLWSAGAGRGKTHALSAVCREIVGRYLVSCIFMTEERIYMRLRECFGDAGMSECVQRKRFQEVECLFIDDFGATKPTPWKNEVMTGILDCRLDNNRPTFFTSNFSPADYQKFLAASLPRPDRIPSRIYEMCRIVEVQGEDRRRKIS